MCSNFILLHIVVQFFPYHFLKRLYFSHCIFLLPLSKIQCSYVHGFISGLSILLHWPVLLCFFFFFFFQYHTVLMTVALWYRLKSDKLIAPAPFFFLKIALAVWDLLCFHTNSDFFCCSSYVKNVIGNLMEIALNMWIAFCSTANFTILILPTQEHGISLCLFMSSLVSFISVL